MPPVYAFDDARRSIRIIEPRLPQPWINYLSNGNLHAFISQSGGGLAWWRSPLTNRLTRYRQYNLPIDSPGFYIYLRERDGTVWSPTWRPVETQLDAWHAEHTPGMTRFHARRGQLTAEVSFSIPPDENVVVWDLEVKNGGGQPVKLDVFGYVEFGLLDWRQDTDWACYVKHNIDLSFDGEAEVITYLYRHFHFNPRLADCPLVWFGSSEPVHSHACDRDAFVGVYRDERSPVAVERNYAGNSNLACGDPCGALQCQLVVQPQERRRMQFFLGAEPAAIVDWPTALDAVRAASARLRRRGRVDALEAVRRQWWNEHFQVLQADLPDSDIGRQINTWNPVQCVHTGRYSRSISQHAAGVRTLGFRDTCQDMLAIAYRRPDWATRVFHYLISQQYPDGHTPHQCNPVEKLPAEPRVHIDNPLWLPMLAHAIICETGDLRLLDATAPWLSPEDNLSPQGEATVWGHLLRVSDFLESNLGAHGLPLTHKGDWNDSIGKFSTQGRGESIMAAQQYAHVLGLLSDLARMRGEHAQMHHLADCQERQLEALRRHGWDGHWWRRGYDDNGQPIGSTNCEHGKIWLNSQSWAVISGCGSRDQQIRAMNSVAAHLDTGYCGIRKLHPGFPSFPEVSDPYTGYSPGCGENGAIFCHANAWAIIAEALLQRPERAWDYYNQLLPHRALQTVGLERYKAEPYAYVSNIIGPENPNYGWANVTQVTGTAVWMDLAATQYLLGLRPTLDGLQITPCLPDEWPGYSARRLFRGCEIHLSVCGSGKHVEAMQLDGSNLEGNVIPATRLYGKKRVHVNARLSH